jgi:hypothetical protein
MHYRKQVRTEIARLHSRRPCGDCSTRFGSLFQEVLPVNTHTVIISPDAQLNFYFFRYAADSERSFLTEDATIQYVSGEICCAI